MTDTKKCYHCGLEAKTKEPLTTKIDGQARIMCCFGCKAVAEAIVAEGLADYYQHRTTLPDKPDELIPKALERMKLYDRAEVQHSFVVSEGDKKEATLILEGIVCAACVWLSEKHINQIKGVVKFSVNYTTHRAHVVWDESEVNLSTILQAIADIGYMAHPFNPDREQEIHVKQKSKMMRQMLVAGLGMMQAMMMAISMYLGAEESPQLYQFLRLMSWLVATPVVLYSAQVFFKPAWRDLKAHTLGMDVPVSIAIILAYGASMLSMSTGTGEVYFDSVSMFVFFLLIGRFLEQSARHKAGQSVESQAKLLPAIATVKRGNDLVDIVISEVQKGDVVVVQAGDVVPVDGVVTAGQSSVDEAILTGENLPKSKTVGDKLIAGSINIESSLQFEVKEVGAQTVMAAILRLLDKAQDEKPRIAQITDQVAIWFVSFILVLSLATGIYWSIYDPSQAIWIVVSVLVVTCPCALSLAIPVALTVATGSLSKNGLLIRKGHALETLAQASAVVFDKTGTLTEGKLKLDAVEVVNQDYSEEQLLQWASALESYSEHPLAKPFTFKADHKVSAIKVHVGQGIEGRVDGQLLRIGTFDFVNEIALAKQPIVQSGIIQVFMGAKSSLLAAFSLSDSLRPDSAEMIAGLADYGIETHLFSGDRQDVTVHLANQLKIKAAQGGLLPDDKLIKLQALQAKGHVVIMCGDGVNDAPVLAAANASIAMAQGTNLAKGHSDMILVSSSMKALLLGVKTAKKTMNIIKQNISWAVLYNIIALPLAIMGLVEPWMAAIGMSVSSLLVVLNALRLMDNKKAL